MRAILLVAQVALVLLVHLVRVGQRHQGVPVARLHLVRVRVRVRGRGRVRGRFRVRVRVRRRGWASTSLTEPARPVLNPRRADRPLTCSACTRRSSSSRKEPMVSAICVRRAARARLGLGLGLASGLGLGLGLGLG